MKRKKFTRLIDTIFAARDGEEMSCTEYFSQLPRYIDLEISCKNVENIMPDVHHHMHQCPECEEIYLAMIDVLDQSKVGKNI